MSDEVVQESPVQSNPVQSRADRAAAAIAALEEMQGTEAPASVAEASASAPAETPATEKAPAEKRLSSLLKAKQKAQAERESISRERQELEALKAELEAQRREFESVKPKLSAVEKIRHNPTAALQELGLSWEEMAKLAATEGTPEAVARTLQEQFEAKLAAERKAREEELKEIRSWREREEQARQQAARQASEQQFVSLATSEKYGNVALFYADDPQRLLADAYYVQHQAQQRGVNPTQEDIAEYLEERAAERINAILSRHQSSPTAKSPAVTGKTLGNQQVATRATGPVDPSKLSREERRKLAIAEVEAIEAQRKALKK